MQYALQINVCVLAHLQSPLHRVGMHRGWYVVSSEALQGLIILLCAASFQKDASWASLSRPTACANRNKFRSYAAMHYYSRLLYLLGDFHFSKE
jgi:hypothetical protein